VVGRNLSPRGLANRQIALTLVFSPRTVENRLQHILNKLDLSSLSELRCGSSDATKNK